MLPRGEEMERCDERKEAKKCLERSHLNFVVHGKLSKAPPTSYDVGIKLLRHLVSLILIWAHLVEDLVKVRALEGDANPPPAPLSKNSLSQLKNMQR